MNGSNAEFDDDNDRASGQAVFDYEDNYVHDLTYKDEPCLLTQIEPCSGPNKNESAGKTREEVEPTAQLATNKYLSFKNFI